MRKIALTRKARYMISGFTETEANFLKVIPLNAPYSKIMRQDRKRLLRQASDEGWSRRDYQVAIARQYVARGWKQPKVPFDKTVIFRMVKDYEKQWHNTAPEDEVDKWKARYPTAHKSHHGATLNHQRVLAQKRAYNSQPSVIAKRRAYRLKNREHIRQTEKQRKDFNRRQGLNR